MTPPDIWKEFEESLESLPKDKRGEELLRGVSFFAKQVAAIVEPLDNEAQERYKLHIEQLTEFARKRTLPTIPPEAEALFQSVRAFWTHIRTVPQKDAELETLRGLYTFEHQTRELAEKTHNPKLNYRAWMKIQAEIAEEYSRK